MTAAAYFNGESKPGVIKITSSTLIQRARQYALASIIYTVLINTTEKQKEY